MSPCGKALPSDARQRCFTLIELLVVVALIALLMSILLPSFGAARERARRIKCASNLRQISHGWTMYVDHENRGHFPKYRLNIQWFYGGKNDTAEFPQVLNPRPVNRYVGADPYGNRTAELFHCPDDRGVAYSGPTPWQRASTYNYYGNSYPTNPVFFASPVPKIRPVRMVDVRVPVSIMVLVGDNQHLDPDQDYLHAPWHVPDGLSMNIGFLDGHAAFIRFERGVEQTARYSHALDWLEPNEPTPP